MAIRGVSNYNLVVRETIFDAKAPLDEENFYVQGHDKGPEMISKKLTYLMGRKNYPITMMAYADIAKKGASQEIESVEYTYPVMDRDYTWSEIAQTITTTGLGQAETNFEVTFTSNWFSRYAMLQSEGGVQARVQKDPEKISEKQWRYTLALNGADSTASCPVSELVAGRRWIDMGANVPFEYNDGTTSKMSAPGLVKNQLTYIRKSMQWAGMSAHRVMKFEMMTDTGSSTVGWMDFFMYQFEKHWMEECEMQYWYNRYNRKTNGEVGLKDYRTGKPIPIGSGLIEQIVNYTTYTRLTYDLLQDMVSDALFGMSDTEGMTIDLYTGTGGMREVHTALTDEGRAILGNFGGGNVADKFIEGTGRNLMLNGFFTGFYHVDGYTVRIKYNPIFDMGRIAMISPLHPQSGLPLESYRLIFIDTMTYDGKPNLLHISHKFKPMEEAFMAGFTKIPDALRVSWRLSMGGGVQQVNSAADEGSYHRGKSMGVQIVRATKCFHAECFAGI